MARRRLGFWRRFAVMLVIPFMSGLTKRRWSGQENLPATGGVIVVPNHISHFDPLVVAHYIYANGRWPRFLGKASIWKVPVVGFLLRKTRQIPVERGSVEAVKSLDALIDALHEGGVVIVYPEGTTTREPDLWPMRGKTGAARLALVTGAPVLPMANDGAQQIFDPRSKKFSLKPRTPVSVTLGKPVELGKWLGETPNRTVLEQMTEAIMTDIQGLVGEVRGETPPPLFRPGTKRGETPSAAAE